MRRNAKTVVVSGANGFLGLLFIKRLYDAGIRVVSIVHPARTNDLDLVHNYSCNTILADLSDPSLSNKLPQDPFCFVHFAWQGVNGSEKGDEEIQKQNIANALYAAEAANSSRALRFIGIGTVSESAYLNRRGDVPLSPGLVYGKYKRLCYEKLAAYFTNKNTEFLWLRLANLYGSNNKTGNILSYTISALINGQVPEFGPCDQLYDFVLANDAIEAIFRFALLEKKPRCQAYFIGSGSPRLLKEYLLSVKNIVSENAAIAINKRPPDGLVFKQDDFVCSDTIAEIGPYISANFEDAIKNVVANQRITGGKVEQ